MVTPTTEIIFIAEEAADGGYTARALDFSIFTEADEAKGVGEKVRDAVRCHFDEGERPRIVRLHFVRQEILTV